METALVPGYAGATPYVSAANLDAIDFVGLGLLVHATSCAARAYIDVTVLERREGTERFDPRSAVPLPTFDRGPDGLVKQVVEPLATADGQATQPRAPLSPIRVSNVDEVPEAIRRIVAGHTAASFAQQAFDRLAPGVVVMPRADRSLGSESLARFVEILDGRLHWAASQDAGSVRPFTQGGFIELVDANQRLDRWSVGAQGDVCLIGSGIELRSGDLLSLGRVIARGPLDAATWPARRRVLCAHLPWFLDAEPANTDLEPHALELVDSLFLRVRPGVGRDLEASGVLLDEYADAGLDHYQVTVGAEEWLYDTVRWAARSHPESSERWAWSQAAARKLTEEVRRARVAAPPPSLLRDTVDFAGELDLLVVRAFDMAEQASSTEWSQVQRSAQDLGRLSERWQACHRRWRVPADFGVESDVSLDGMTARISGLSTRATSMPKALAGIRSLAWRVVENGVRTVMLVGDTYLRASLPILALFAEGPVLAEFSARNGDKLRERLEHPQLMSIV